MSDLITLNKIDEIIALFSNYGIDDFTNNDSRFKFVLQHSLEELESIIKFCTNNNINCGKNSFVFCRNVEELSVINDYIKRFDLPTNCNVLFKRTPDEIYDIVMFCHDNNIDLSAVDYIFNYSMSEIREIVDYCIKNNISYSNQMVFLNSFDEIKYRNEFCKKSGIDFFEYLTHEVDGNVITYKGVKYLVDNDGDSIITCFNPKGEIEIPPFIKNIAPGAFQDCIELEGIIVHKDVSYVGEAAFKNCQKLNKVVFKGSLSEFRTATFEDCYSLKNLVWPSNLKVVGDAVFRNSGFESRYNNDYMESTVPNTVTTIGVSAFEGCSNVNSFIGHQGLSVVKDRAFSRCYNLKQLYIDASTYYFDPTLTSNENLKYVYYGPWYVPVNGINKNMLIGYKDYAHLAENIYNFSVFGLKSFNEVDKSLEINTLPMYFKPNSYKELEDSFAKELVEIIARCPKDKVYSKVFSGLNYSNFVKNAMFLCDDGLSIDRKDICKLVVDDNNYNLLKVSYEEVYKNFDYLKRQKLVPYATLRKLFFGDAVGDNPDELLKDYYKKHKRFPELFNVLLVNANSKNQLELRDRLVYVSTMQFLDDGYSEESFDRAVSMLKSSLFENVIFEDKREFLTISRDAFSVVEEKYPKMMGMMCHLYDKMNGIDSSWFIQMIKEMKKGSTESTFENFFNSLETVKNWNSFTDEVKRATYLKNEIVARLLYADIVLTIDGDIAKKDAYISKKKKLLAENKTLPISKLLEFASKDKNNLFKNPEAITTMLTIDPYSFDALRRGASFNGSLSKKNLEAKYARVARAHGYMFTPLEVEEYKKIRNDSEFDASLKIDSYINFITNSVGIAKIPEKDRKTYLNNMRNMIKFYVKEKSEEELFKFCRSFDLYLRNNNEYLVQGEGSEEVAKEVFDVDSDINNDARIIYCLYNLNRIAHDALELNCKAAIKNKFRLMTDDGISYEKMQTVFDAYNKLYRCGIDAMFVELLLDKNNSRNITNFIFSDESNMSEDEIKNRNQMIQFVLNNLNVSDVREKRISLDEIDNIKDNLKIISSLTDEEEAIISTSVVEQSVFFECKRIFSEEIMKRLAVDFSSDFKTMMSASVEEKREFYARNGFIAEIQGSVGAEKLVCLCETFNEPFCVHLKDLPHEIIESFRTVHRSETIACCSLDGRGLSFRDSDYEKDILNNTTSLHDFVGFRGDSKMLLQVMRSNYDNYDLPAKRIREKDLVDGSELSEMFSELESHESAVVSEGVKK